MNDVVCARTYQALNNLCNNAIELQKSQNNIVAIKHASLNAYINEFATVKLYGVRQSGHTTAIARFVTSHQGNHLVYCPSLFMLEYVSKACQKEAQKANIKITKMTGKIIELKNTKIYFEVASNEKNTYGDIDYVFIDCTFFLKPKDEMRIIFDRKNDVLNKDHMLFVYLQ